MSLERLRSGLSPEALQALAGTLGSKAAELLVAAGLGAEERKNKETLLDETRLKLEAFAQQLHPDHKSNPSDYDEWLAEWEVSWDEKTNSPAIWHKGPKTGEYDTDYLLYIKRESAGKLLLPSEMRITGLFCINNQLTSLPGLPAGLTKLGCNNNQLTGLPGLPAGLTELSCGGNQLTSLPGLPARLTKLSCGGNQLTSLPNLPDVLTELYCDNNKLTSLPDLPTSLTRLYCYNNKLASLPDLPDGLAGLYCSNNRFPEGYIEQLKKRYPNVVIM